MMATSGAGPPGPRERGAWRGAGVPAIQTMLRILRAFAWMRWRILVNSLEKTGARDVVERFSLAIEHIAPILLLVLLVPSALALAGVAGYSGYELAVQERTLVPFEFLRYLLLAATGFAIIGPILVPTADRTNAVRLLLLPIPPRALYVAQLGSTLTDPWTLMILPVALALPVGVLAGGAPLAALTTLAAGVLFIVAITGIAALVTTILHLLLRDRRRGEILALLFILILPLLSLLPSVISASERRERRAVAERAHDAVPKTERATRVPPWVEDAGTRVLALVPSELYTSTVRGIRSERPVAGTPLLLLLASTIAVHGIGLLLFQRVLASPGTTGARRTASTRAVWGRTLPGISPGSSAVALTLVRLALRTPRGRAIMLSPLLMLGLFGVLVYRSGSFDFGPFGSTGGFGLAVFAAFVALASILPIGMNQFAVDGAGLTMTLLAPLSTRQILAGKAVGAALISIPPALVCVLLAAATFRSGEPAMWAALILSLPATYILTSPAGAIFSAIFPRVVDMNSIGRGSNAHGLSGFLGMLGFAAAALPCVLLTVLATRLLGRPWLAPVLILLWCGVAFTVARLVFRVAERIFDRRRENLAMLM